VNDAKNVRKFLMRMSGGCHIHRDSAHMTHFTGSWGFRPEDIVVLTDDTRDSRKTPTKANIMGAMKWLVKGAKAHDSLFFHCEWAIYIPIHCLLMFCFRLWPWRADPRHGRRRS